MNSVKLLLLVIILLLFVIAATIWKVVMDNFRHPCAYYSNSAIAPVKCFSNFKP